MPFFATTLLTTGAAIVGIKTKQPQLVRMLDSREPKPAVVPSSTFPTALTQVRQLAQDLFSDTRQRQQQALNATYDVTAAQEIERVHRQNFIVAGSGLGFAGLGALVTPFFISRASSVASFPSAWFSKKLIGPIKRNDVSITVSCGPSRSHLPWSAAM